MKKKLMISIILMFFVLAFVYSQNLPVSVAELDSAIVFLEDSVRVQELVSKLKLIRNAQNAVRTDSSFKTEMLPVNIFSIGSKLEKKAIDRIELIQSEIRSVFNKIEYYRQNSSSGEIRQRLLSMLILVLIALCAGVIVSLLLFRVSGYFKRLSVKKTGTPKVVNSTLYHVFRHLGIYSGVIVAILSIGLILMNSSLTHLINNLAVAVLLYSLFSAVMNAVFSPTHPEFRLARCSTLLANHIVKSSCAVMRFSLLTYIVYRVTISHWPGIAGLIVSMYKILLTLWIPVILHRLRNHFSS
ncbi:MAG: hypothetical protein GX640_07850, partial [Fibrobacter sp.]|nr:hypothetical protein [Fibrobacter sp.]